MLNTAIKIGEWDISAARNTQNNPLARLLSFVADSGYRFITTTPLTHQHRVVVNGDQPGDTLRDIFGWNLLFASTAITPLLFALMRDAGVLRRKGKLWRSTIRIATLDGALFLHSSFPTTEDDAVFFGPDTYRFARFIRHALQDERFTKAGPAYAHKSMQILDIGCGSGAGGIVAAHHTFSMGTHCTVTMNDINPLALQYTRINAELAGVPIVSALGDALSAVDGEFDLILSNPPYLDDASARLYCHGGAGLGRALSVRITEQALARLAIGGRLLLYTGVAIIDGVDPFLSEIMPMLTAYDGDWSYEEIDPDIFGEELERPIYAHVDRIAAVGLIVHRRNQPRGLKAMEIDIPQHSVANLNFEPNVKHSSTLEQMPKWMICVPLTLQWLWLSLRYRSFTLPSAANPTITSGGLVGEGKLEYFQGMGVIARAATADYCVISTPCTLSTTQLTRHMQDAGIAFPVMVKPDLGLCGYGVRKLDNVGELHAYLQNFPPNEKVVLQQYLSQEGEAGIFYARDPKTDQGRIIGLALRYFPRVIGDGVHTLAELINADPRARRGLANAQHECVLDHQKIPATGELVRLSTIASTRVGGLYRDGAAYISPRLTARIDAIARDMPNFNFGRFDVRFDTPAALSNGGDFTIMEINGAGSEAIQAWDPDIGLLKGFQMIFAKQRLLFAIGDAQRRRGVAPIDLLALARLHWRQQRLIAAYPPSN